MSALHERSRRKHYAHTWAHAHARARMLTARTLTHGRSRALTHARSRTLTRARARDHARTRARDTRARTHAHTRTQQHRHATRTSPHHARDRVSPARPRVTGDDGKHRVPRGAMGETPTVDGFASSSGVGRRDLAPSLYSGLSTITVVASQRCGARLWPLSATIRMNQSTNQPINQPVNHPLPTAQAAGRVPPTTAWRHPPRASPGDHAARA